MSKVTYLKSYCPDTHTDAHIVPTALPGPLGNKIGIAQ